MKRIFSGLLLATAIGVAVAACDDGDDDYGAAYGGGYDSCSQATTCGSCTPLNGCGWCFDSDGTGACVSSPDQCSTEQFSWTWDPSGCRDAADAAVVVPDAGASDTGPKSDSAPAPIDAAPGDDAASEAGGSGSTP